MQELLERQTTMRPRSARKLLNISAEAAAPLKQLLKTAWWCFCILRAFLSPSFAIETLVAVALLLLLLP